MNAETKCKIGKWLVDRLPEVVSKIGGIIFGTFCIIVLILIAIMAIIEYGFWMTLLRFVIVIAIMFAIMLIVSLPEIIGNYLIKKHCPKDRGKVC